MPPPDPSIEFSACHPREAEAVEELFRTTFSDAEGEEEGAAVGALAGALLRTTAPADIRGFVARDPDALLAGILFTRLRFEQAIEAFLLAPVAVRPGHQRQGLGRALIRHGLHRLQQEGVELLLTYGDPRFYSRVGFSPASPSQLLPPLPLSRPEGWMAQSLSGDPITPLPGRCRCVAALNHGHFW